MRTDLKRAWIKALRSGEYTQGRGGFKRLTETPNKNAYCCLGVLAVVCAQRFPAMAQAIDIKETPTTLQVANRNGSFDDRTRQVLGITEDMENKLISMNDSVSEVLRLLYNFKFLADVIEQEVQEDA